MIARSRSRRVGATLFAGIALVAFFAAVALLPSLVTAPTGPVLLREAALIALSLALVGVLAGTRLVARRELGLRRVDAWTLATGVGGAVVTIAASSAALVVLRGMGLVQNEAMLAALAARPAWMLGLIALTAGISEEAVFRAILVPTLGVATGSAVVGPLLALAAFAVAHLGGWGWQQVVIATVPGAILTLLFLWRRDLVACIIAHALTDTVGLIGAAAHYGHAAHG